jgi:hypothetical protein
LYEILTIHKEYVLAVNSRKKYRTISIPIYVRSTYIHRW